MPSITLKNVQFTNVKDKRQGLKMSNILTQSNVGSQSVANYINSENFYKLVSALDIAWGDISVGNGVIISDTADLINWISSLPASGGGGKSAYELYVEEEEGKGNTPLSLSEWLESLQGQQGINGVSPHIDPSTGNWFIGETNTGVHAQGINGLDGSVGKSAYEIYVEHVPNGSTALTEEEWLASLKGKDGNRGLTGESAYEIYFRNADDPLSEEEWLASLKGADGTMSFEELTDEQRESLVGETGPAGPSAYQSYRNTTADDPILTEEEWVASLHGQTGAQGITPHIDPSTKRWMIGDLDTSVLAEGINGQDGSTGKSAYELYVEGVQQGEPLSQEAWLESLNGDTAYEVAVANGFNGTEQEWLDSLLPSIGTDPSSNNANDIYWFINGEKTQYRAIPQIISITSAAYEALQEKDANAIYVITDSQYNQDNEVSYRIGNITPTNDMNNLDVSVRRVSNVIYFDFTLPIANIDLNNLTEAQASLLRGKSNYQIYVDNHDVDLDGPLLTEAQWIASLKGETGDDGKSAYELYTEHYVIAHGDDTGMLSEAEWLNSLIPQIVKDSSDNLYWHINNQKTEYRAFPKIEFLTLEEYNALVTKENDVVYIVDNDREANELSFNIGNVTTSAVETDVSVNIRRLDNSIYFDFVLPFSIDSSNYKGESAYEIYRRNVSSGQEVLSESQWIASLYGKSAYELYAAANPMSPYTTEAAWLESLKGATGKDGSAGPVGPMADISINADGYWVINNQITSQLATGRLPEIRMGLYIDPETSDETGMYTWWLDGVDTHIPTSLGVNITTLNNKIGAIGNASEYEPSTYYTAQDEEVIAGTKEVGDIKTPAVAAVPHTVKSYVDNAVANVHVDIDTDNIYTKEEVNQKFADLIGNAPETLDTLKEIADKLSDEDTSLGQLNTILAVKADASTVYTKSEVYTKTDISTLLANYVTIADINDNEEVVATALVELNNRINNIDISSALANYVTVEDISINEYVISNALIDLHNTKADKDTTYTKEELDSILENLDNGVDPNDLSIYELKSDLANDLSIYERKSDLTNDLSIYKLKAELEHDLSNYVLKTELADTEKTIAAALVQLNEASGNSYTKFETSTLLENKVNKEELSNYVINASLIEVEEVVVGAITAINASINNIVNNTTASTDLSIYELKSDLANDLSIYELKSELANDLSIYALNTDLLNNDASIARLNTLLTDKVDASTVYTKSEVDDLINNIDLTSYVLKSELEDNEQVIATALVQMNNAITNIDASIIDIKQNGGSGTGSGSSINPNDLSIYQLKSDLANDLSIYELKSELSNDLSIYQLKSDLANDLSIYVLNSSLIDVEEVITESITQLNDAIEDITANIYTKDEIDDLIITSNDLSIYKLKSELSNDLSIYELKSELANDLSIYKLKSELSNDLSIYELKSELSNDLSIYELKSELSNDLSIYELKSDLANDLSIYESKSELSNDLSIYVLKSELEDNELVIATALVQMNNAIANIDASIIDIKENGGGVNASTLENYALKSYIGTLPNKTENIYYTQEEIESAVEGDDAYGKETTDIKTAATQYTDVVEAIAEGEEVAAAAIIDVNNKLTDISTRLSNIVLSPTIWVGTQTQYNALESIDQTTIYIIKADEV